MKLVAQNHKSFTYCKNFLPSQNAIEIESALAKIQSGWRPGEKLGDFDFRTMLDVNRMLRKAYDSSPARVAGMKKFDAEFAPLLGWSEYFSQHLR